MGQNNDQVVALTADLLGSLKMNKFADTYPHRFIQTGIAEANMMGIAAGLATAGKIPLQARLLIFQPEGCMIKSGRA